MEKEHVIDVEFNNEDSENTKEINGTPLYWTTSQVSALIGETDSTIRFWCSKFKDLLNIKTSGRNRKFTQADIDKLVYIKKLLREDKFSIKQVIELATEKNMGLVKEEIQNDDPFVLQALASALSVEMGNRLEQFKEDIVAEITYEIEQKEQKTQELLNNQKEYIENLENQIKGLNEKLSEQNELTIDKLNNINEQISAKIDEQEKKAIERDVQISAILQNKLDQHKQEAEINQQKEGKKGFFSKFFK